MTKIRATCPNGHKINAPSKFAGRQVKCPKCQEVLTVPQPATESGHTPGASRDAFGGLPDLQGGAPADPSVAGDPFGEVPPATQSHEQSLDPAWAAAPAAQDPLAVPGQPVGMSSAYAPVAKPVPEKAATSEAGKPWGMIAVIIAGSVTLLTVAIGIPLLLLTGGSDDANTSAAQADVDVVQPEQTTAPAIPDSSDVIVTHIVKEMRDKLNLPEKEIPGRRDQVLLNMTKYEPTVFQVSATREAEIQAGNLSDPDLDAQTEALRQAYEGISRARPTQGWREFDVPSEVHYAEMLATWREQLLPMQTYPDAKTVEQIRQVESLLGERSIFAVDSRPSTETRLFLQLMRVRQLLDQHIRRQGYPTLGGLPLCVSDRLSWRVALMAASPHLVELDADVEVAWDAAENATLLKSIPVEYLSKGVEQGFTCLQAVEHPNSAMTLVNEKVQSSERRTSAIVVMVGPELASGWTTPPGIKIDSSRDASQLGTPPLASGYPALTLEGKCIVIPPNTSGQDLLNLFVIGDQLPTAAEFKEKFPSLEPPHHEYLVYRFQNAKFAAAGSTPPPTVSRPDRTPVPVAPATTASASDNRGPDSAVAASKPTSSGLASSSTGGKKVKVIFGFDSKMREKFNAYLEELGHKGLKRGFIITKVLGRLNGASKKLDCPADDQGHIPFPREDFSEYVELFESGRLFEDRTFAREIPTELSPLRKSYEDGTLGESDKEFAFVVFAAFLLVEIYGE